MLICEDCGNTFKTPKPYIEPHGETNCFCPYCGSSHFDERVGCEICGEDFAVSSDKLHNGICEECLLEYKDNYDVLKKIALDESPYGLSTIFMEVLGKAEMQTILFKYIKDNKIDCSKYIKGDIDWFADKVKEMMKNGDG